MPYTADPVKFDWMLVAGDTAQPAVVLLLDANDEPYDLTGVTGECQLRAEPGGEVVLEPTVSLVDADAGEFTFASPAEDTVELRAGRYRYSVRLTWPDDTVRTVLEGTVTVRASVVS